MSVRTDPDPTEEREGEELRGQMSFLDHLEELRRRILNVLIAVAITFAACWTFAVDLFNIVQRPILAALGTDKLVFNSITEPFNLQLKIALVAAIFLASPFIMAQVWLFIAPGLYKHERRYAAPFIIFSTILFVIGGIFGYFIAFPFAVQFLVQMGREMGMVAVVNASDYFDKFIVIELGLGIVFEIPALTFVLSRIGLVTAGWLLKNTKYAVLLSFVVAAIITPTSDIPNMMIMAVPMIVLYLVGILVAFIFGKKRKEA
jgi:sec-independent protein translocase protein TatC